MRFTTASANHPMRGHSTGPFAVLDHAVFAACARPARPPNRRSSPSPASSLSSSTPWSGTGEHIGSGPDQHTCPV